MQFVAIAAAGLSAVGSLRQGQQQAAMYRLQAQQAQLKASRDALQYEQQANSVLDRLLQNNATAAAKGFAGGVSGFSGSAKLVQERSTKVAGKDVGVLQEGSKAAISFGEVQSRMLNEAASDAITGSYFDAIGKLGTAAASYNMSSPGGATTKAPVVEGKWSPA
jgi:hypothetical protein